MLVLQTGQGHPRTARVFPLEEQEGRRRGFVTALRDLSIAGLTAATWTSHMERTLKNDPTLISPLGDDRQVRAMPSNPFALYAGAEMDFASSPGFFATHHGKARDDLLAFLLIHTWTLITGRELRSDVPPTELSEEELIAFWADDHIALADSPPFARAARTGLTGRSGGRPVPPDGQI